MKRILFTIVLFMACLAAHAQTAPERAERFLDEVATPESDAAFDRLFAGSGFAELKPQALATLKSQTKMAMGLYGKPIGIEKIREEDLSPSLKRLVYLQKFEGYPVAWEFYFYRPKTEWLINQIQFKDQVDSLIGARQ